ncbi:MAG: isovaleryl-CoA dehydrogenase [Alphaproteobacteria bacterium]|nr:isovaleryl-CoA dehydrogenase [Alphaproteobacteria bacterium]
MPPRDPVTQLNTHEVTNQPPPLVDYNLYGGDSVLRDAVHREGGGWADDKLSAFGAVLGRESTLALGANANRYTPELRAFDRYGQRIDEVEFHPSYHELMALGIEHQVHSIAWTAEQPGGHVVHTALEYLLTQVEAGVCCPLTMTNAAVPILRRQPQLAREWESRVLSQHYDLRAVPIGEKRGATIGMAMTEKQGGSDVRANTTRARALGACDQGEAFALTGHKWFCSAPMSDAFFTLAYTDEGLSCFFVPRWHPDGSRNPILIQRLKDKLGNRSNASSEIEYNDTWACLVGNEGEGVKTILEMVHHTRLDTALAAAGLMRQAVVQAVHHARYRRAFQKNLIDQPLMQNVLADLTLEWLTATIMIMRVARAYDETATSEEAGLFARLSVAVAKYWINKRLPQLVYEAMECLGGAGYVEESILPRLYREAPLNSIWEGSGNVICLDVLRTIERSPAALEVFLAEVELAKGGDRRLDALVGEIRKTFASASQSNREQHARSLVEDLALAMEASLVIRHMPGSISSVFVESRLGTDRGHAFGTLPPGSAFTEIIAHAQAS